MIKINKKVGETPLELIDRVRLENSELKDEKLSYAGRLDPMAEGEMIILVGEENNEREKYLGLDKEYVATFLVGVKTDTGDILGLHKGTDFEQKDFADIHKTIQSFIDIKKQTYPWFSGKTVDGKKLFEYFKEGNTDIERPILDVDIKEVEFLKQVKISKDDLQKYIFDSISKVNGDFRQKEILEDWSNIFINTSDEFQTFDIKIKVSSGTFIRALCEEFDFPVCLLRLKRTKVFI
jgi:tRNA pseudouridine(55) synthase